MNALARRAFVIRRNIEVDGGTAYLVAVIQLACGEVLRNIDHHVYLLAVQHVECLRLAFGFAGPVDARILHTVLRKEVAGTTRGKYLVPLLLKHTRGRKHVHFLLRSTGRKQDILSLECDIPRRASP